MSSLVVAEIARAVEGACESVGARWFLFGAQAAILRGLVRHTEDVDVTVDLRDARTEDLIAALRARGLTLRVADASEFIAATRVIPLRHLSSGTPVDVVLAASTFEDRFFDDAESQMIDGAVIRIARLEDLISMKLLAGRPQDIEDVVALLVANPKRDEGRIRDTLGELEAALDQNDLIPLLEASLARAARALRARR
jgi:hypothetical protein